jgi:septum formation topological specificity factor MinE
MNGQQMLKRDFVGDLTPREGRTRRATALAAKQAARSPVTLVGIGAASLIALACQLVAPLAAVPVIFGVLFLLRLRNGRTWDSAERTARTSPIELPDLIWYSDAGAQAAIRRLGQARRTLASAIAHSPQDPENDVLAGLRSVAEIERRIVLLASRVEYLGRFLSEISLPEIEAEAHRVRSKEANASTAEARARYQLGVAQREAQLRDARALEARRDQLLATIDYMLATLEMLPLKLTRLQLLRVEAAEYNLTDYAGDTAPLFTDLEAIEEVFIEGNP